MPDLVDVLALPLPDPTRAEVVAPAPGAGPGHWAGAPSAVAHQGVVYLAYRLRRPVDDGRGYHVVVARLEDEVRPEPLVVLDRRDFGAASLERPALVLAPDGGWRLYLSCATPGSKHWRIDAIDAPSPDAFRPAGRRTVLPGDAATGVKDPVVWWDRDGGWEMWACCHPLDVPGAEDRMESRHATSEDGLHWTWSGARLRGTVDSWDCRGARVTSRVPGHPELVYYDGRASAAENWRERCGVAAIRRSEATGLGDRSVTSSPHGDGALRYVAAAATTSGARLYYELARPDGAHDLVTQLI